MPFDSLGMYRLEEVVFKSRGVMIPCRDDSSPKFMRGLLVPLLTQGRIFLVMPGETTGKGVI